MNKQLTTVPTTAKTTTTTTTSAAAPARTATGLRVRSGLKAGILRTGFEGGGGI